MLDEKKIEEAKKAFIADKKILGIEAMNDLACGFKAGAHWAIEQFLKDLWHPASEEPKESVNVIAEVYFFRGIKTYIRFKRNDKSFAIWNNGNTDAKVIRWLYIDDLLPKQKGGE